MDPNAALQAMRDAMEAMHTAAINDDSDAFEDAGQNVAEYAQALDTWLSKGGFLPEAWQR